MTTQFIRQLILGTICLMGIIATTLAEAGVPIKINAWGIHYGGQIVYRYQIENNSASTIDQLRLGLVVVGKELPGKPWSLNPNYWDVPAPLDLAQCKPFSSMDCTVAVFQFDYMAEPKTRISMRGGRKQLNHASQGFFRC